jgi:hypothetical protein
MCRPGTCHRHDKPYAHAPRQLDPCPLSVKALKKSIYLQFFESVTCVCPAHDLHDVGGGSAGSTGPVCARRPESLSARRAAAVDISCVVQNLQKALLPYRLVGQTNNDPPVSRA